MNKRKILSTSVALALSALIPEALEPIENEERHERHAQAKAPENLELAIQLAEQTTGATSLSVHFIDEVETTRYTVELLTRTGTRIHSIVDLADGRIDVFES